MRMDVAERLALENRSLHASPHFSVTLQPCYALPPAAFGILFINIAAMSYLSVITFFILGANALAILWCADVVLCIAVYRWQYATHRQSEHVELTERKLCVMRLHSSGKAESWDFDPCWVRFEYRRGRGLREELRLASHGRELVFGAFLSRGEKARLAAALSAALAPHRVYAAAPTGE